jgi:UDP-N-acetyl-D-galactosamine dehydrogenase
MGKYVAEMTVKKMIAANKAVKGSRVLILGLTFKENVPDIRNTRVIDIVAELRNYGVEPLVHDPMADPEETRHEYGIELVGLEQQAPYDAIVCAVSHDAFKTLQPKDYWRLCCGNSGCGVIIDVKSQLDRKAIEGEGLVYWAL